MRRKAAAIVCATAIGLSSMTAITAIAADSGIMTEASAAQTGIAGETLEGKKWSDFIMKMDGQIVDLPMMYSDFVGLGWTTKDDLASVELEPMQYEGFVFEKDGHEIYVNVVNLDQNSQTADKGVVYQIKSHYDSDVSKYASVELPGGIKTGEATLDDIKNAYGAPTYENPGNGHTVLLYELESHKDLNLDVDEESGKLTNIDIMCLDYPDNFQKTEVSSDVPATVSAYQKPAQLSNDPSSYQIRIMNSVYTVPMPVSTLLSDGFTLTEDEQGMTVPGGIGSHLELMNGGQKARVSIENFEKDAVTVENAWVTGIVVGPYDLNVDAELAGGIKVGMKEDDLKKLLSDWNITPEVDDSDTHDVHYKFCGEYMDHQIDVEVTKDDSFAPDIPQGCVLKFSISNNNQPE